jgi:very-short-patch-repair endonuclease
MTVMHEDAFDAKIAEIARRQHGVISHRQLRSLGLGRGAITWRLQRGRLHRLFQGVYAVGHLNMSQRGWWMAAALSAGGDAVLSHRSAAGLWLLRPVPSGRIEVTTPRRLKSRRGLRFHSATLPEDEITTEGGIPVTEPSRTIFDLAAATDRHNVELALRQANHHRLTSRISLPDLLLRYPGYRGTATIKDVLGVKATGRTKSPLEERFLRFLHRARLPRPELNVWLDVGLDKLLEIDCVWRAQRVALELDSRQAHETPEAFQDDRRRDRALTVAGWRPVRVTDRQLKTQPKEVERDLRALLLSA